jgi:hypothetical protein
MGLTIPKLLLFFSLAYYFYVLFFSKQDKNEFYLKFTILILPLLNLKLFSYVNGFILISYLHLFFYFRPQKNGLYQGLFYRYVIFALIISITVGIFVCDLGPGKETFSEYIGIFPIFIFTKTLVDKCLEENDFFYHVIDLLKITAVVSFVFLVCQMIFGVNFSINANIRTHVIINNAYRYTSFLSDPQHLSQYLASLSFICLIRKKDDPRPIFYDVVLVIFCLIGILSSGGRGGLFGLIIGLGLVVLFSKPKVKLFVIITAAVVFVLVMNFQNYFSIFKRSTDLNDTYEFRYSIWVEAYNMFLNNPFFGIGLNNYSRYVYLHNPNQFWKIDNEILPFDVPESGYLKILSETGVTGFVPYFSLILLPLANAVIRFFKTKDITFILFISAILSWMISFNGTYSFFDDRVKLTICMIITLLILYIHFSKVNVEMNDDENEVLSEN